MHPWLRCLLQIVLTLQIIIMLHIFVVILTHGIVAISVLPLRKGRLNDYFLLVI